MYPSVCMDDEISLTGIVISLIPSLKKVESWNYYAVCVSVYVSLSRFEQMDHFSWNFAW